MSFDIMGYTIVEHGKIIASVDYNPLFSRTGGKPTFTFPNSYMPHAINQETLRLSSCTLDTKSFGCISSANQLESLWNYFQTKGLPLSKIAESFLVYDVDHLGKGMIPIPSIIEPILLIDSMNSCRYIKGVELRFTELKKELTAITDKQIYFDSQQNVEKQDYISYIKNTKDMLRTILSAINEFQLTFAINQLLPVDFSDDKGKPDLILHSTKDIKIDAKLRLADINLRFNSDGSIEIPTSALLGLLCKEAYPQIVRAFDDQSANIVMVNLTMTEYGILLSTELTGIGDRLDKSLNQAIHMTEELHKQVVILYSKARGQLTDIYSVLLEREEMEMIGANIDKIEKIARHESMPLNFHSLARMVKDLINKDHTDVPDQRIGVRNHF
jgi:hypothetical protein